MIFFLDFETRSLSPLKVVGGRNYVDDPATSVLALCGTDGVRDYVWSPFAGPLGPLGTKRPLVVEHGPYPTAIVAATEGATLLAHNAEGFDRPLWEALGLPERVWIDSIPLARRAQLPGKLQDLAERVLGVGKDKAGRDVTLSLSKPVELSRAAVDLALKAAQDYLDGILYPKQGLATLTMLLGGPGRASNEALKALLASPPYGASVLRDPSPAQLTEVVRYCLKDVELMREVCLRARLLEPHMDDDALEADRRINARGVAVDLPLVHCLLRHADRIVAEAGAAASAATDGAIGEAELRKTAKLRSWLAENGVVVDDTKAETIKPLLATADGAVATVLRARLDVARVSTGKLRALVNRTQRDGRLRGMHGYYDAHTGRWTGRDVQTQNLPRAIESTPESLPDDLLAGAPLPATSDRAALVGSLIRSCFVGDPGLIVADFSQVEARALCYLAGDEPGLAVYLSGADPYLRMASLAFGEPVTDKKDKRRQAGKIAELACGYGGGPDALLRMAKKNGVDLEATGACPARLVEAWRDLHPAIAGERSGRERTDEQGRLRANRRGGFWKQLEREARRALRGEGDDGRFSFDGTDLFMHLPSGRVLRYRDAQLGPFEDRDDTIHYWNPKKKKRVSTYAGRLCENFVQSYCRDFLAEGLVRLEVAGYRTVLHTHDEFVVEGREDQVAEVCRIVSEPPAWAADFPLAASGSWSRRYAK